MTYADNEGVQFTSTNKVDLVLELYLCSWVKPSQEKETPSYHDLYQYCMQCTDRLEAITGVRLEWFTTIEFIDELIEHNLIMEIH